MSITISNAQEIHNSPLNLSMTKQLYSFPKASRFDKLENPSYCKQAYYDRPEALSKRATTLGYGQKYDLAKHTLITPGPDVYKIKGDIDDQLDKHKGFQFGVSREQMTSQSIFGNNLKNNVPGPGRYEQKTQLSDIKYTMRSKGDDTTLILNKFTPGPGAYTSLPALTAKGEYPISKFRNSGACTFNPKSNRFSLQYTNPNPGPGHYNTASMTLQKSGQYFINGFQSSPSRSFPHQKRETGRFEQHEITPGPGMYKLPSEFGHYQSKRFASTEGTK